jgi:hypothetical protein
MTSSVRELREMEGIETPEEETSIEDPVDAKHQMFRKALWKAKELDNPLVNAFIGAGVTAAHEAGSIAFGLSPLNIPREGIRAILSGKPSDFIRSQLVGTSPEQKELDKLMGDLDRVYGSDVDSVTYSKWLTQFVSILYGGGKISTPMRALTLKVAPGLIKTAGERKLINQVTPRLAKALRDSGDTTAANILARSKGEVVNGVPILERTMMAIGNGLGFGAFEATREISQTGDVISGIKHGGAIAALGPVAEMVPVVAGRSIFKSFRQPVDVGKLEERWKKLSPDLQEQVLAGDASIITERGGRIVTTQNKDAIGFLSKGEAALAELVDQGVMEVAPGFIEMTKKMTVMQRRDAFRKVVKAYKKQGRGDYDKVQQQVGLLDPGTDAILSSEFLSPAAKKIVGKGRKKARSTALKKIKKVQDLEETVFSAYHNANALNFGITVSPNLRLAWTSTPTSAAQKLKAVQNFGDDLALEARMERLGFYSKGVPGLASIMRAPRRVSLRTQQAKNALQNYGYSFSHHHLEPLKAAFAEAPASMAKKMGVAGLKFAELYEQASAHARLDKARLFQRLDNVSDDIANIMESPGGLKETHPHYRIFGVQREGNSHIRPIRNTWEKTGSIKAIEDEFGTDIAKLWKSEVVDTLDHYGRGLQNIGVNSMMSALEMQQLGVGGYFPQLIRKAVDYVKVEDAMRKSLIKTGTREGDAMDIIGTAEWKREGAQKFGTIDFQRKLRGSTQEKLAGNYVPGKVTSGIPLEDDPIIALKDHFESSITRLHLGTRFGANFELGTFYKMAMIDEGASEHMATALVDAALFQNIPNNLWTKLARNITASQIIMKLSWAAIPNAFQTTLTGVRFGPKSTIKGIAAASRDLSSNLRIARSWQDTLATSDKKVIAESLGLLESSLMSTTTLFSGRVPETMLERVAQRYMGAIQFTRTERINRVIAAHTGLYEARRLIEGVASGKLVGENLTVARRSLDSLGVNIDKVLKRHKKGGRLGLSEGELDSVVTQSVKQTQFTTGPMDVPTWWRTPTGRVVMQFKSFAFNSGRLIRDQVFREFDQGNYKPLLYFASLGTMSGEMVGLTTDLAKGRDREPPDGLMRVVEDLSFIGGFGLAQTMAMGVMYGQPLEAALGPMVSTISGVGTDIGATFASGDPTKMLGEISRQPISRQMGRLAEGAAAMVDAPADVLDTGWWFQDSGISTDELRSMEDLRRDSK